MPIGRAQTHSGDRGEAPLSTTKDKKFLNFFMSFWVFLIFFFVKILSVHAVELVYICLHEPKLLKEAWKGTLVHDERQIVSRHGHLLSEKHDDGQKVLTMTKDKIYLFGSWRGGVQFFGKN